jgi:hypothetical protein
MKRDSGEIPDVDIARGLLPQVLQVGLYHRVTKYAGELRYQIGTFDRLHIASIPITYNPKGSFYLILSIGFESDPVKLIQDQLIPLIEKNKDYLL